MSKTQKDFNIKATEDLKEMIDYYKSKLELIDCTPPNRLNKLSIEDRKKLIQSRIWELEYKLNFNN